MEMMICDEENDNKTRIESWLLDDKDLFAGWRK